MFICYTSRKYTSTYYSSPLSHTESHTFIDVYLFSLTHVIAYSIVMYTAGQLQQIIRQIIRVVSREKE